MVADREAAGVRLFVRRQLSGQVDLSTLTLGILKKRYLAHVGCDSLNADVRNFMKQVVQEELMKMQDADKNKSDVETTKPQNKRKRGEESDEVTSEKEEESSAKKFRLSSESKDKEDNKTGSEKSEDDEDMKSGSDGIAEKEEQKPEPKKNGRRKKQISSDKDKEENTTKNEEGKKTQSKEEDESDEDDEKNNNDESDGSEKDEKVSVEKKNEDSDSSTLPSLEDDKNSEKENTQETKNKKKKKTVKKDESSTDKKDDNRTITRLKRYISLCGVRKNYKKLLEDCRSIRSKVAFLKKELEDLGVQGQPSIKKCKKVRMNREEAKELAELDASNIITTKGRPKRRAAGCQDPDDPPSSVYQHALNSSSGSDQEKDTHRGRKRISEWANLRGIISDDADSE